MLLRLYNLTLNFPGQYTQSVARATMANQLHLVKSGLMASLTDFGLMILRGK